MTKSVGTTGLTRRGSAPRRAMASRIAAKSTMAAPPLKSWWRTRAGTEGDLPRLLAVRPGQGEHVRLAVVVLLGIAERALEQDAHRVRQAVEVDDAELGEPRQAEVGERTVGAGELRRRCRSRSLLEPGSAGQVGWGT